MLTKKMQEALNKQLNAELYSSYLYLSMSAYFKSTNLDGFAHWMRVQSQEELAHAMKFFDYISSRAGRVTLRQVDGPTAEWASPLAAFENVYQHEQKVTGLINELVNLAVQERDPATNSMLQWFVNEQVEEEENANGILQQIKRIGSSAEGLLMLDRELAKRVFVPPKAAD